MAQYQGISGSIFDEPEYRDVTELAVAVYIMLNRDMAGVCPIQESIVAKKCRTSVRKLRAVLSYFEEIGKVEMSIKRTHVWLKSGIAHSLYKGHFSMQHMSNVVAQLSKWDGSQLFASQFGLRAVQLLASKYSLVIPYPSNLILTNLTLTKSETKKEEDPAAVAAQSEIHQKTEEDKKTVPPKPQNFDAYEDFHQFIGKNKDRIYSNVLQKIHFSELGTPDFIWDKIILGTMVTWIRENREEAGVSLARRFKNSWLSYMNWWVKEDWLRKRAEIDKTRGMSLKQEEEHFREKERGTGGGGEMVSIGAILKEAKARTGN